MRWQLVLLFVVISVILGACTAPIAVQSANFKLTMSLEQVGLGKRPVTLTLHDLAGNPVRDATVTLLPVMRQHGMLAPPMTVQSSEPGVYVFPEVNLDMSGEWQMQLTIVASSVTDMIEIPVIIE